MARIQCRHAYHHIISLENLLAAWKEFLNGKRGRKDVQEFELRLMQNIISLHNDLVSKTYKHSSYHAFNISDPKPRSIHKASVRDRLLHHAIYRELYPFFDRIFIADSFSCRFGKGMHKAIDRFRTFARKASLNHTKTVWVLKCDIRKFFASVDQKMLMEIMASYIPDKDIIALIYEIVGSFHSATEDVGLPLGNLTSQLLVNIYMNEFDQFVKHKLKVKYYIRYADDFVIFSRDKEYLEALIPQMQEFLTKKLRLQIHPNKISIKTIASGTDYLGWVHFPNHRVLRTVTKRRMMQGIRRKQGKKETVQSYLGLLSHGNSKGLQIEISELVKNYNEKNINLDRPYSSNLL
jgi:retron-type reverse transcriptase